MVFAGLCMFQLFIADDGVELKFFAREAFVSREGFRFLVAGRMITPGLSNHAKHIHSVT